MSASEFDIQGSWDPDPIREDWAVGQDFRIVIQRLTELPVELTARGATGRVLEVAAAEATHSCHLARRGLDCYVVEPATSMLARARDSMAQFDVRFALVRGIAETLPFPDGTFDRVLIDSALDHLAAPEAGIREMVRVLRPEGRLVLSFVNYGGLTIRSSRAWYRLKRAVGRGTRRRFWDSPVPVDHTFECTMRNIRAMCGPYLELEEAVGLSFGWAAPGWPELLGRLGDERARRIVERLDRLARRTPGLADCVVMVWRPRAGDVQRRADGRHETMRVRPTDPAHRWRLDQGGVLMARWQRAPALLDRIRMVEPWLNRALTGDPKRSWVADVAARGPFGHAALLGGDDPAVADTWLRAGASERLDVIGPAPLRLTARPHAPPRRVGYVRADLDFVDLRHRRYDAILAGGALCRVVNLEYLFDECARALRPGGLLALSCYVGERRHQYDPERLALVNAALHEVPARFRLDGIDTVEPERTTADPLRAVRSDEIPSLAMARFDVVHAVLAMHLFPLAFRLDLPALAREEPGTYERVFARERALRDDPSIRPGWAYLVLRRRAQAATA